MRIPAPNFNRFANALQSLEEHGKTGETQTDDDSVLLTNTRQELKQDILNDSALLLLEVAEALKTLGKKK